MPRQAFMPIGGYARYWASTFSMSRWFWPKMPSSDRSHSGSCRRVAVAFSVAISSGAIDDRLHCHQMPMADSIIGLYTMPIFSANNSAVIVIFLILRLSSGAVRNSTVSGSRNDRLPVNAQRLTVVNQGFQPCPASARSRSR